MQAAQVTEYLKESTMMPGSNTFSAILLSEWRKKNIVTATVQ